MPRQQAVDLAEALLAKVGLSDKRDAWPLEPVRRPAAAGSHRPRAGDEAVDNAVR